MISARWSDSSRIRKAAVSENTPDRLIIAIVQNDDIHELVQKLVENRFGVTRLPAAGGFLRRENAIVLVAANESRMPTILAIVRDTCRTRVSNWLPPIDDGTFGLYAQPIEVEIGGAVLFAVPIERAELLTQFSGF